MTTLTIFFRFLFWKMKDIIQISNWLKPYMKSSSLKLIRVSFLCLIIYIDKPFILLVNRYIFKLIMVGRSDSILFNFLIKLLFEFGSKIISEFWVWLICFADLVIVSNFLFQFIKKVVDAYELGNNLDGYLDPF